CLVIHRYDTMELAGVFTIKGTINIPYKAGYLAFREAPVMLELISNLRRDYPELVPQVIIVDGNGIWHPRGCGIASHFSVLAGIPCIGMTKNVLYVENIDRDYVEHVLNTEKDTFTDIVTSSGKLIGTGYNVT